LYGSMVLKKSVETDGFLPRSWSELIPNILDPKTRHAITDSMPTKSMRMHAGLLTASPVIDVAAIDREWHGDGIAA
jgi:hypothetical protein